MEEMVEVAVKPSRDASSGGREMSAQGKQHVVTPLFSIGTIKQGVP